ncbi:sirohydrochlorin chelatase [Solihabitans fulvus]|uniref:Sirohydrochlorin chelatase n=1 Tax=Solihabitans fulvus TaxID=1892852 RepID=A0A5B2XLT3_9PSEU|nr:sirohydrochlorin chelatase [Solihabitans fulvus]
MTLVLVAHGTRDPAGAAAVDEIAAAVRSRLGGVPVAVAYADVRRPDLADVLGETPGPVVLVPAFLAAGYHVRVDLPAQLAACGRPEVLVARPLGPDPAVVDAVYARLAAAGWRRGDAVVLAAAGSSDARALAGTRRAAALLAARVGGPVAVGYVATASPTVAEAVAASGGRAAVASWLLAPGLFHRSLDDVGAAVVADPIGAHPALVDAVLRRYRAALGAARHAA